jgi:hypothetical protein
MTHKPFVVGSRGYKPLTVVVTTKRYLRPQPQFKKQWTKRHITASNSGQRSKKPQNC